MPEPRPPIALNKPDPNLTVRVHLSMLCAHLRQRAASDPVQNRRMASLVVAEKLRKLADSAAVKLLATYSE